MNISPIQGAERPHTVAAQPVAPVQAAISTSDPSKIYYYSPALTIDPATGTDVLQIRDSSTGAVTAQYPSEKDLKAYEQKSLKPETPPPAQTSDAAKLPDAKPVAAPAAPVVAVTPSVAAATTQVAVASVAVSTAATAAASPKPQASIIV